MNSVINNILTPIRSYGHVRRQLQHFNLAIDFDLTRRIHTLANSTFTFFELYKEYLHGTFLFKAVAYINSHTSQFAPYLGAFNLVNMLLEWVAEERKTWNETVLLIGFTAYRLFNALELAYKLEYIAYNIGTLPGFGLIMNSFCLVSYVCLSSYYQERITASQEELQEKRAILADWEARRVLFQECGSQKELSAKVVSERSDRNQIAAISNVIAVQSTFDHAVSYLKQEAETQIIECKRQIKILKLRLKRGQIGITNARNNVTLTVLTMAGTIFGWGVLAATGCPMVVLGIAGCIYGIYKQYSFNKIEKKIKTLEEQEAPPTRLYLVSNPGFQLAPAAVTA